MSLKLWCAVLAAVSLAAQFTPAQTNTNAPVVTEPVTNAVVTNPATATNTSSFAPPQKLDESAFKLIGERNIFNANRSGGQVRLATRRATRIESMKLVGTMAYDKGAYAFFEGSSSELTKAVKADGVIAGHKVVDVLVNSVKLEFGDKLIELPIGSALRREDEGDWHLGDAVASSGAATAFVSRDNNSRSSRSRRGETNSGSAAPAAAPAASSADQSEALKRLMERREKDSQ